MFHGYHFYDETGKWFRSENRHGVGLAYSLTFQWSGQRYNILESIRIDNEFHLRIQRVEVT